MSEPIYKVFLFKPTEAWYQLSQEEQTELISTLDQVSEKAGIKHLVGCDSSWASEQWQYFGVDEYPSIEAVHNHTADLVKIGWFRYVDSMTVLGTKWPET